MSTLLRRKPGIAPDEQQPEITPGESLRSWLCSWEIYLILLIAVGLRFWGIDRVTFAEDEAAVFHLAHDAIVHGLLPITSNKTSLGSMNPPLVVYMFMIPAAISSNPVGGEILVALFNTAAVLLAYIFTRRYYGRLAGTIAALLYATAVGVWTYSRNIWSPNFEPFFALLFLLLLFRGVVDRRKGWFFPAVVVLGLLYQFHSSSLFLVFPLAAAVLFAYRTIRPRELVLAALGLLLVFLPYAAWMGYSHFADLPILLDRSARAITNFEVLHDYLFFVHPTLSIPYTNPVERAYENHIILANAHSILQTTPLSAIRGLLNVAAPLADLLLVGGMLIVGLLFLFPRQVDPVLREKGAFARRLSDMWSMPARQIFTRWWSGLWTSPDRQGLLLLLLWQLAPLCLLLHHSIMLFTHYLLFLMPGPFILLALGFVKTMEFARNRFSRGRMVVRYGTMAVATLLILAQLIGCSATLIDQTAGYFDGTSVIPSFNDVSSLQHAFQEADQLAQQRHIHRIYVPFAPATDSVMQDLSEQVKTPIELENTHNCLILPDPDAGPVVMLTTFSSPIVGAILNTYADVTLVDEPQRLAGSPFKLYILTAKSTPAPVSSTFSQGLQLLSPTARVFQDVGGGTYSVVTHWRILATHQPALRTTYGYKFQSQPETGASKQNSFSCSPTATWAGDQLFAFPNPVKNTQAVPSLVTMQVVTYTTQPELFQAGPLTLLTAVEVDTSLHPLFTTDQRNSVSFPVVSD